MSEPDRRKRFEEQSGAEQGSLIGEFVHFLRAEKKWWLIPILVALCLVGALALAAATGAAPFIYTLF